MISSSVSKVRSSVESKSCRNNALISTAPSYRSPSGAGVQSIRPSSVKAATAASMSWRSCWAETVDGPEPAVRLRAGDMVIFPAGDANIIASAPGMRGAPDAAQYYRPVDRLLPFALTAGRDAAADRCRFVCGFLGCDTQPFNPLLEALPRIVRAPVSEASWQWVARLLDAAVDTAGQGSAGQEAMLTKLAELMFVEALRGHLERLPPDAHNWVAGLRDP